MAKQRNSLGICVLPIPNGSMTWDEYKETYKIDLSKIFYNDESDVTRCNPSFSKLIAVSVDPRIVTNDFFPYLSFPTSYGSFAESDDSTSIVFMVFDNNDQSGVTFKINAYGKTVVGAEY